MQFENCIYDIILFYLKSGDRLTYGHGSAYGDPTYTSAPKNYDTRCLSPGSEHGAKGYVDSDANYRNYGPNRTDSQHSGNVPSDKHGALIL